MKKKYLLVIDWKEYKVSRREFRPKPFSYITLESTDIMEALEEADDYVLFANREIIYLIDIYEKTTPVHKETLGYSEEYECIFRKRNGKDDWNTWTLYREAEPHTKSAIIKKSWTRKERPFYEMLSRTTYEPEEPFDIEDYL